MKINEESRSIQHDHTIRGEKTWINVHKKKN